MQVVKDGKPIKPKSLKDRWALDDHFQGLRGNSKGDIIIYWWLSFSNDTLIDFLEASNLTFVRRKQTAATQTDTALTMTSVGNLWFIRFVVIEQRRYDLQTWPQHPHCRAQLYDPIYMFCIHSMAETLQTWIEVALLLRCMSYPFLELVYPVLIKRQAWRDTLAPENNIYPLVN